MRRGILNVCPHRIVYSVVGKPTLYHDYSTTLQTEDSHRDKRGTRELLYSKTIARKAAHLNTPAQRLRSTRLHKPHIQGCGERQPITISNAGNIEFNQSSTLGGLTDEHNCTTAILQAIGIDEREVTFSSKSDHQ